MNALDLDRLSKRFAGGVQALVDLSLAVPAGGVYGLLGPNGAGKSTLLRIVTGLVHADSGSVSLFGEPASVASRRPLGALIEGPSAWPAMTATGFLRVIAQTAGVPADSGPLLERVGLTEAADRRVGGYSLGMKQRLGIAAALLGDPDLLILDEPTNGLDPVGIREIRTLIGSLKGEDRTVLVSSHLLSEVEQICDHLVIIEAGAGIYSGPTDGFSGALERQLWIVPEHVTDLDALCLFLVAGDFAARVTPEDGRVVIDLAADGDDRRVAAAVNRLAHEHGIVLAGLHPHQDRLEDRYLSLVAGGSR
jgi:ABC-2 type transport system ATP-binding protein